MKYLLPLIVAAIRRPVDEVSTSDDLFKGSQSDKSTDPMWEINKIQEDSDHQGKFNTGKLNSK